MDYNAILENARAKLEELRHERTTLESRLKAIEMEMVALGQTISALAPMATKTPHLAQILADLADSFGSLDVGLTDRVRQILRSQPDTNFAPTQVKANLEMIGFDLRKYSNAMAVIHMVLKRLVESREAIPTKSNDGGTVYRWRERGFETARQGIAARAARRSPPATESGKG